VTTSGSYSFSVNASQIVRQAMLNIGKLDESETPSAQQSSDCIFTLNLLIKQWQGRADFAPGLKVWTRKRGHLFLSNSTGQYSVGPTATGWSNSISSTTTSATAAQGATAIVATSVTGIAATYYIGIELDSGALQWTTVSSVVGSTVNLAAALAGQSSSGSQVFCYQTIAQQPVVVETALLRDIQNADTPLRLMTVQDYDFLPNKTSTLNIGDPSAIYYETQLGNSYLYTDVGAAQDVSKHIVLTYLEPVQDILATTDTFAYPQEWYLALAWGLASEITPMFNAQWTAKMEENFKRALSIAQRKDPERVSLYFQPGAED
jgi:hypothetical protein